MYTSYVKTCNVLAVDDAAFDVFRSNGEVARVVETLTRAQGEQYFRALDATAPFKAAIALDAIGHPTLFKYGSYTISPLMLRYLHQIQLLVGYHGNALADKNIGDMNMADMNIIEVGGGFGGHASLLTKTHPVKSYTVIDLPSVAGLIQKYTTRAGANAVRVYPCTDNIWRNNKYDLFISHYCFSELDAAQQDDYLPVIRATPRGFMICNIINRKSHHKNKIIKWIQDAHPSLRILDEEPQTYRGNYVLVWND